MKYRYLSIIFLILVLSIGAVCAQDDAADAGDVGAAGSDDVLSLDDNADSSDSKLGSGNSIEINDENYNNYFSESGTILENANISDNDTLILGNINDKVFDIDRPLTITSNGTPINNTEITLNKGSDNSIIENLTIMNEGDVTAILVSNAENITIISNKIFTDSIGNNNAMSAVFANLANNLKIMDNIFEYVGRDNDTHFNSNIVIGIVESDGVLIEKNKIQFAVESNATASNKVILASQSNDIVISHNVIGATIPSRSIDWYTGNVYSEGIALDDCNEVTFTRNIMAVKSSGYTGEYDTIYGLHVTGDNVSVVGNVIGVLDAPYGYALVISGEEFAVGHNLIYSGIDIIELLNKSVNFTDYNYDAAKSGFYDNLTSSIDIKTIIDDLISNVTTPYACGIEVDGLSTGVIELNMVATAAVSSYGIYTANWAGDVIAEMVMNYILGAGDTVFGMSLSGSESLVEESAMALFGNYTTGIASTMGNINITSVAIDALGSNEGTPAGYDMMGIETTGIHIATGDANITKSHINTTGKYAVDFDGEGQVTGNELYAELLTGDFAVDYIQDSGVLVVNNTPAMELDYILTNDTFYIYFDEEGRIREQIVADNLTFNGPFSDLVDEIIIDRPIDLLSDDATLNDMGIEILSDNVTVDGFDFYSDCLSAVIIVLGSDYISISDCSFQVIGVADDNNYIIYIADSGNVLIDNNVINSGVDTNGTYHNKAIYAFESDDLVISQNQINPYLPARSINWTSGEVYSEAVSLNYCDDAVLYGNDIFVLSGDEISDYDTVYAVHILGDNASILGNEITVEGAPYGYGLVISGENFTISENDLLQANEIDVEGDAYACGIEIDGPSNGVIKTNNIKVNGDSAYGVYTANWAGDVIVNITGNMITSSGITAFGMSLSGSEASVELNTILMSDGNFTTGIASAVDNILINENEINAVGSNVGTPAGYDSMGIETTGIHIVKGNAIVTGNEISANNDYAVDFDGEGQVTDNEIYAQIATGDFAVDYAPSEDIIVENNTPEMDYELTNDTFFIYFYEDGYLKDQVRNDDLTFIGEFSNLVEAIFIDRPIALLSDNATLNDMGIYIQSGDVSVDGFNLIGELAGIVISDADNVEIINNNFTVTSEADAGNLVIGINDCDNVLIENNTIVFGVETNGTYKNRAIDAQDSENLTVSGNTIVASIPARPIDWTNGTVYSRGVVLDGCDNAYLFNNTIAVKSNDQISTYDTIYAADIKGDNVGLFGNRIGVLEAPYGYGVVISGENFEIAENEIYIGQNGTYACAIEVDGTSNGIIGTNLIYAIANDSAYGIYTANWAGDVIADITDNFIYADANSPFGMSLSGSESYVENNNVLAVGNYTTGIVSAVADITINNNTINANGSNVGTPLGYDMFGIETTGVHIVGGNATVTNNNVTTTGEYAVDTIGTGEVTDNYLIAAEYMGDASVDVVVGDTLVLNNTPVMERLIIQAEDVVMYYKNGTRYVIKLTDMNGKPIAGERVTLTVNGASYNRTTDENGTASMAINLGSGNYTASVSYIGSGNCTNSTIENSITVLSTVLGDDLVKVFKNASQYYATFLDGQGNPLTNGTAVFNINGVMYERKINENGTAKLNINLAQGTYIITATHPVNGEKHSNNITVISRITDNNDLVKYYKNASQYVVTVLGDDGKPVGAGENVTFNINGVMYTRTTNESGQAKLNINLAQGNYTVTAEYKGCKVANNIEVLPILKANDLVKKYGTSDQFIAYLVDGQGKAYPEQTVSFNINGVHYNRVTDADGRAILNIKLGAAIDTYTITSSYNGCNIVNTIKIEP